MRSHLRLELPPSKLTPDGRRRELVGILAQGLRRLRDRAAISSEPTSAIPSEASN